MKISEILNEGTDIKSTVRAITNDIGTPISDLFDRIKYSVQRLVDNNGVEDDGKINGLGLVVGGETGRWINIYWSGKLENELYDLIRYAPTQTQQLKNFLQNNEKKNFGALTENLPQILKDIANKLQQRSMYDNAAAWEQSYKSYQRFLDRVRAEAEDYGSSAYDRIESPKTKNEPNPVSQQNVTIEAIINDALGRIDKKQAGEIRNAISKSGNKLMALQQEFRKRGIEL